MLWRELQACFVVGGLVFGKSRDRCASAASELIPAAAAPITTRTLRSPSTASTARKLRFACDSLLEGDGFELPVPREKKSRNLGIPLEFN